MNKITINLYDFNELEFNAKCNVINEFIRAGAYPWEYENFKSWETFSELYLHNFSYNENWESEEKSANALGDIFNDYISGKLQLTGYCMDYTMLEVVEDAIKNYSKYGDYDRIYRVAKNAYTNACEDDEEYFYSLEHVSEYCESNEYKFLFDGTQYRPERLGVNL